MVKRRHPQFQWFRRASAGSTLSRYRGFTLVEMLVVIAIIGILTVLLLAAVQSAREAGRRAQCANNLKQLAAACHGHHDTYKKFPYARKYDIWDSYTWTQLVLPYMEQKAVYDGYVTLHQEGYKTSYPGPNGPIGNHARLRRARHAEIKLYYCPSDASPTENEIETKLYGFLRGNYRGCVGSGDMYGEKVDATSGPWGVGVFGVKHGQSFDPGADVPTHWTQILAIDDGTSQTLLLSEGLVPEVTPGWGGPLGEIIYGNMGGALFSAARTPNSSAHDWVYGPCPQMLGDRSYIGPCLMLAGSSWWAPSAAGAHAAARSEHPGGVNAAMADGSVRFVVNFVDQSVWRAMATRKGHEPVSLP